MTMLTTTDARAAVVAALHRVVPEADVDAINPEADLRDELEMDSLDFLAFVENLSQASGVHVDEDDYPSLRTIATTLDFLVRPR